MLAQYGKYPEFVPDQILTRENLDDLFNYLDEQGRITRTNLIGIGIVCGLEVKTSADGKSITISKGTGVTSEGYLISFDEATYTDYVSYDPTKEKKYDRFNSPQPIAEIYELKKAAVEASTELSLNFLNGNGVDGKKKVVLLFVELLKIENKNCNPNSCDDKGITIEVNIRPLLVNKADVSTFNLAQGTDNTVINQNYIGLDEIRLPRWDVLNTRVATTKDLFNAYNKILSAAFLNSVENLLTSAWNVFKPIVGSDFGNANPFSGLASSFNFLHDGSIDSSRVIFMQYYYDHFSDLLAAYDEFRITGTEILSTCCPDSALFKRHLLLDLAIKDTSINYSQYRHYFIYSPLFQQRDLLGKLKTLFQRMVLMRSKFSVPAVTGGNTALDPYQRITPSRLDYSHISNKAIPYYYMVNSGTNPLVRNWSFEKNRVNASDKNLSYHAAQYTGKDYVINPLKYDLEPYNFLRIEGIIGKQYTHVLANLKRQIHDNRLPVDVIALNTDDIEYTASRASHNARTLSRLSAMTREGLGDIQCYFKDLEAIYDSIKNEMLCTLCKELKYYYEIPIALGSFNRRKDAAGVAAGTTAAAPADEEDFSISEVTLFEECTKVPYRIKENTFGVIIERIYRHVGNDGEVTINEILEALGLDPLTDANGDGKPDTTFDANLVMAVMLMMPILELPIYIIRLANYFTPDLHEFDINGYCKMHERIAQKIAGYKSGANLVTNSDREAIRNSTEEMKTAEARKKAALALVDDRAGEAKLAINNNSSSTTPGAAAPPPPPPPAPSTEPINVNTNERVNAVSTMQNGLAYLLLYIMVLEDLYDHLDILYYNCKCKALMAVKEEYLRRVTELAELRQLQNFSRKHPGLQHKAGVTMGGTFIIVYHHPTRKKKAANVIEFIAEEKRTLRQVKRVTESKRFSKGESDEIERLIEVLRVKSITLLEFLRYADKIGEEPEELIEIIKEIDARLLKKIKGLREEDIDGRDEEDDDAISEASDALQEGVVIADFYLPYLCYSNCPPVIYQVGEIKDVPVNVTLGLQPNPRTNTNVYSVTDADGKYLFTSSPEGGTLNNGTEATGVVKDGDKFLFVPSMLRALLGAREFIELNFTYTAQGNTSTAVKVIVYNAPNAVIKIGPDKMPQPAGTTFKIAGEVQFADKYSWMIDGKEVGTEKDLGEQKFDSPGTYTISLAVTQSVTGVSAQAQDVQVIIAEAPAVRITGEIINTRTTIPTTRKTPVATEKLKTISRVKETDIPTKGDTGPFTIPSGGKISFISHSENAKSFEWFIDNKKVSTDEHLEEFAFKKAVKYSVWQVVTGETGETAQSNIIEVNVVDQPNVEIVSNLRSNPATISLNTGVLFNSKTENADTWHWTIRSVETGLILKESEDEHLGNFIFTKSGEYTVELVAKQKDTGKEAAAAPWTIIVAEGPSARIVTDPATIPQTISLGSVVTFNSEAKNADQYMWMLKDATGGVLQTGTGEHFGNITFNNTGTFFVSLEVAQSSTGINAFAPEIKVVVEQETKEQLIISIDPPTTQTSFPNPTTLSFRATFTQTSSFRWLIDGQPTTASGSALLANVLFNQSKTYTIQAEAILPTTGQSFASSNVITIEIQKTEEPQPTKNICGELSDLIKAFQGLEAIDKRNFPSFAKNVMTELGVAEYFKLLERIVNESPDIQLEFFESEIFRGALIDKNLSGWTAALRNILLNADQKAFHVLAAALYRILVQLTMYIACIHKEDIANARLQIADVLNEIRAQMEEILKVRSSLATKALEQIMNIRPDVEAEINKMDINKIKKPFYRSLLDAILSIF